MQYKSVIKKSCFETYNDTLSDIHGKQLIIIIIIGKLISFNCLDGLGTQKTWILGTNMHKNEYCLSFKAVFERPKIIT